ncbi:MAG TPA: hypothetical protein VMW75_11615 [Thermoanaerobaculia bacterium]|nr:hypothetical protein [Thermoanaerobaculia bacterium]
MKCRRGACFLLFLATLLAAASRGVAQDASATSVQTAATATLYAVASNSVSTESVSDIYTIASYAAKPAAKFVAASPVTLLAVAIDPTSSQAYGLDYGNELYTVNLTSGATSPLGKGPRVGFAALAFNGGGTGYEWGFDSILYLLDKTDGHAIAVGDTGYPGAAMAFDTQGILYGGTFDGQLVRIDTASGAATVVGPLGDGCCSAMATDPAGNLYGANLSGLYRVDKTSGNTRHLGDVTLLNPDPSAPAYIVGLGFAAGRPAPSMPTASYSWYVYVDSNANPSSGSPQAAYSPQAANMWAQKTGAVAGKRNVAAAGAANFIILDFGSPRMLNNVFGTNGEVSPKNILGLACFADTTTVANVVKSFIEGYEQSTQLPLYLAVGLTNEYQPMVTSTACKSTGVPENLIAAHGNAWAQMLVGLDAWVTGQGYHVFIASAVDAEMDYATNADTLMWYQGFNQAGAQGIAQYDFGDSGGCRKSGSCNNGWTTQEVAGLPNMHFVPEIYVPAQAAEWEIVAQAAKHPLPIEVVLSGDCACASCSKRCGSNANFNPCQAWQELVKDLNSSPKTAPIVPGLTWSTDLCWRP